jgi:hypothetical protein
MAGAVSNPMAHFSAVFSTLCQNCYECAICRRLSVVLLVKLPEGVGYMYILGTVAKTVFEELLKHLE